MKSQLKSGVTAPTPHDSALPVMQATAQALPDQEQALTRARAFAEPLLATEALDTGENILAHADAVAEILRGIGGSQAMQAASYLVYACDHLNKPQEVITKAFGDNFAALAMETTKLVRVQRQARLAKSAPRSASPVAPQAAAIQTENVRKMLLAFSRDLRVVMLRLASRLQTLRYFVAAKTPIPDGMAAEALQVFAPLANRLGIWQIKWEMEDLAFRFLEPATYRQVAQLLDETRLAREAQVQGMRDQLEHDLRANGVNATVTGRPKHIYSIVKKMRGKSLDFDQVYDVRALRVVVASVPECYAALSWVHSHFTPLADEFDDYIARPKVNGYQSLHTVVCDAVGKPTEIQIRTQAMHDHAETGVAAHWAYKEAGAKGYAGVSASGAYDAKIAVLRQLLAWQRDLSGVQTQQLLDDRIYVLTPDASIVELPQGATPVDFAYTVHTDLGHRCRGARVDGVMVPLNTALKNGQTVEVNAVKEGGPSRDWLNSELGYLVSHRARTKVRAWFNALAVSETIAKGREAVEKLLQREGKTALKLDDLAVQLGFDNADALFEDVGKDEFSLRQIEQVLRPAEAPQFDADAPLLRKPRAGDNSAKGGLLVVGVDSLMTQMAKCCKPAPPDAIVGFVTRGKGVSVHRKDCPNLAEMVARHGERLIDVEWGLGQAASSSVYPVDVAITAQDRQGLLRDISEV
ncbi:MAG: bifunctional (p)ppGpp synthetase/guanosine-3',5'-bis(diphosphate) 3'-pyrophosphohydrolase, partial [Rhodoferax sp.]|nr:bifunctional (p)ppGpp synthetase/guanosine-3',5'-bis(diphosphate) 3'-pyrophosphohydrolase [Rhodoferax sp.]